ncbi:xanthine dehydrogenase accessory protein XdhC [Nitrincola tapanii]|uniref:Xanthine dehydrogenase accessory protein XdhC n=1 Tax=Nitrincola tapanii TaxID=1708751 RepID=A0A5A9W1F7_9GAMM|nr:xanthine dehydrogenase accessory protein XdhC [Nitrincola tapanii]KAA0874412.1 xanthine dehydrogenase accessory protein XdhC [Nitrincola tapanii]
MKPWSEALARYQQLGQAHVLISVISRDGSVPREPGSKMLVSRDEAVDTIGGGHLEYRALAYARTLLQAGQACQRLQQFPLAASLGQCCGGQATLLFEVFPAEAKLWLFGAGHVGRALSVILSELPVCLHWVDSRAAEFPAVLPAGVQVHCPERVLDLLDQINAQDSVLVMTHRHDLDYDLCLQLLKRSHPGWIGLIGSRTKAARFRHRFRHAGIQTQQLASWQCPVGLPEVAGKRPMEVAVSIAGQLIQNYQSAAAEKPRHAGLEAADLALWTQLQHTSLLDWETK